RRNPDISGQDPLENVRVILGRTSPGAADLRIADHEFRNVPGDILEAVAYDHQRSRISDQIQSGLLSRARSGHLENLPSGFGVDPSPAAFGEEILFYVRRGFSGKVDGEVHAVLK